MRQVLLGSVLSVLFAFVPVAFAETAPQPDLTGSWIFTWDNDSANTNAVDLKHEAGTITGTYKNDSGEKCPVVGRLSSAATVVVVVMCPGWDIKADGSIAGPTLVTGKYLAYGDSTGEFRLTRN